MWLGSGQGRGSLSFPACTMGRFLEGLQGFGELGPMPATWHAQGKTRHYSYVWCLIFMMSLSLTSTSATPPPTHPGPTGQPSPGDAGPL